MKYVMTAVVLAGALVGGVAVAQTARPGAAGTGSTAGAPAMAGPAATMGTTTGVPALGANSQAAPPRADSTAPAAVTTTSAPSRTAAAPVSGANSFTEGEARSRIQDRGFSSVTGLAKDAKGVWRGQAMKDGKQMAVALDYQGNIVSQ